MRVEASAHDYGTYVLLVSKSRLKSSISTSTLMAGFALVAIVEVNIADETPIAMIIPFSMMTALLIFVHLLSLIIATRILPEIVAYIENPRLNVPQPITKGHYWPVQMVWYLSNIVGVLLFLVELILVAFVKFFPKMVEDVMNGISMTNTTNPLVLDLENRIFVGTATLSVVFILLFVFVPFTVIFFKSLSKQKVVYQEDKLEQVHNLFDSINQSGSISDYDF